MSDHDLTFAIGYGISLAAFYMACGWLLIRAISQPRPTAPPPPIQQPTWTITHPPSITIKGDASKFRRDLESALTGRKPPHEVDNHFRAYAKRRSLRQCCCGYIAPDDARLAAHFAFHRPPSPPRSGLGGAA